MGVYQVADERDVGPGRAPLIFNDDPAKSDFFLELDRHSLWGDGVEGEDFFIVYDRIYDLRWPGNNMRSSEHIIYAHTFVENLSNAIRSGDWDTIKPLIDIPSFVDFYIVQELMKNTDVGWFSVFMTIRGQDENRKMHMGPVWDFDQSSGNSENRVLLEERAPYRVSSPEGLFAGLYNYWYRYLLQVPEFRELIVTRWAEVADTQVAEAIQHIRDMFYEYRDDFELNFLRHPICLDDPPEWIWVISDITAGIDSFYGHVEYLLDWLEERVEWLNQHFAQDMM